MPLAFLGLGFVAVRPLVEFLFFFNLCTSLANTVNLLLLRVVVLDETTLLRANGTIDQETQWATPFSCSRRLMIVVS